MSFDPLIDPVEMRDLLTEVLAGLGFVGYLRLYARTFTDHVQSVAAPTDYRVYAVPAKVRTINIPGATGSLSSEKITGELMVCSAEGVPDTIPLHPGTEWKFVDAFGVELSVRQAAPVRLGPAEMAIIYNLDVVA